ncbi:MAG TPA: hypothetical protein VLC06_09575 [Polyangia bacterium]|nr:hypothetical protein [Polyangia bacterium]
MKRPLLTVTVATLLAATACGGGTAGEPLVSSTLTAEFNGQSFKPMFGVEAVYQGSNVIALGDGALNCASTQQNDPPMGTTATFSVPMLEVGTYPSIFVDMIQYEGGNFDGVGSNDATVTLTAVSASSVAGTVAYSYTDSSTGGAYSLSGSFEVSRCPM